MSFARSFFGKRRRFNQASQRSKLRSVEGLEDRRMFAVDVPFSFAWVDSTTSTSGGTPSEIYSHNTSGEDISVEVLETGRYLVEFEGLADDLPEGGNVQVTPYGGNHVCVIEGWFENGEDVNAYVSCYDTDGARQNGRFNVAVVGEDNDAGIAFAWTQQTTGTFNAAANYAHNEQGNVEVENFATGRYRVTFEGLGDSIGGNVQVTGYGSSPVNAVVSNWQSSGGDLVATIDVSDLDGNATNSRFSIAVMPEDAGSSDGIAYAWANRPGASENPVSQTYSNNPAGPAIVKERLGEGSYRVTFSDFNHLAEAGGHIMVSAYGSANRIANVASWASSGSDIVASVRTYDLSGNAADANFSILATPTPQPVPEPGGFSYAWVNSPGQPSSTPSATYSYNATGGDIAVQRNGVGDYYVTFDDISSPLVDGGNVQVSPYGSNSICTIGSWNEFGDDVRARVYCYDTNGVATDSQFNVSVIDDSNNADIAYAWMGRTTDVTYESDSAYAYNPEGNVAFTRVSEGRYQAVFAGLGDELAGGHVQVTPYGPGAKTAIVRSWAASGDDFVVNLSVEDVNGDPVDGRLSLAVIPAGENPDLGYAWAGNASASQPDLDASAYAYNPSGLDIEKTRVSAGRYDVTFRGVNNYEQLGGHVMVSPYGSTHNAAVAYWSSGGADGDMTVRIITTDENGSAVDGRFTIAVVGAQAQPGDFNGDGAVDHADLGDLCRGIHNDDLDYDLNNDGVVDKEDMDQLVHDVLGTHYGDANLDGTFDSTDLVQIFAAGKYETGADAVWAEGDFNCDGVVDSSDLVVALADGGYVG